MLFLGIDPGKSTGIAVYDSVGRRVVFATNATADEAMSIVRGTAVDLPKHVGDVGTVRAAARVGVEQMSSTGQANSDILRSTELGGRLFERCCDFSDPVWLFRRTVLRHFVVSGGGRDGQIIDRISEAHGGSRKAARGSKKFPGPMYGVAKDAWQALAVAILLAETSDRG